MVLVHLNIQGDLEFWNDFELLQLHYVRIEQSDHKVNYGQPFGNLSEFAIFHCVFLLLCVWYQSNGLLVLILKL